MEFEIRPDYTVEDFAAFWYGFLDKKPGKKKIQRISARGMWGVGWLFAAAGGCLLAVCWRNPLGFAEIPASMVGMGLAFLVLGVVTLIQWRPGRKEPVQPRWAALAWKKWQAQGPEQHWVYRFSPAGVELHVTGSDHRYDYSKLKQSWEDEEHFYLNLEGNGWHILNKGQFVQGDPACFAAFLAEQTGRPVQWVNGRREERGVRL